MSELKKLLSPLGIGTWGLSGAREWGKIDENEAIKIILQAIDKGITTIDCASIYGLGGAELLLGKALKQIKRDNIILTSKCGLLPTQRAVKFDLSAKSIKAEIEVSLKRLNTDYLDIYFLHWPDRNTPISESLGQMELLKREGKIRFIGLSNFNKTQIEYALKISKIDCVQAQFSLLKQDVKNMFEFLESNDICFMAYGVLGGGILSGKYKKVPQLAKTDVKNFFYRFYKQDVFETNNQKIQKMCSLIQKPCSQIALNWVRAYKEVSCTLFGARSIEQLNQNIDALSWNLTEKEREVLTNIYEGTC